MASSGPQTVDALGLASGLPTAVGDGWYLVGHMTNTGGMFDGNSNLSSSYSFGTYTNNPYGTADFYRSFPIDPDEVLFITGDNQYWGRTDYDDLKAVIDAKANDYTASFNWTGSTDGATERSVNGSVLSRPSYFDREDPWIALEGGHNIDSGAYNLMLWGESNYSAHTTLKNEHQGVNLYVRSLSTVTIEPSASSFNEGGKAIFGVATTGFLEGTSLSYSLSGVSSSDIVGGVTSGSFTVGPDGRGTITVPLKADAVTEGNETLTLTSQGVSTSVTVVDSLRTPGATQPQNVNSEGQASGLPSAVGDGWYLVARIAPNGGMFDGNSNLSSTYSYGTYPNDPYASQDFYRTFPVDAKDILFITGDNQYWARTDYELLKAKIDFQGGDYGESFQWLTSKDGATESNIWGSVLSRPSYIGREDPWIALEGEHADEIALGRTSSSAAFSLMLWGESDYYAHTFLKSTYDGVNVYVRPTSLAVDLTGPVLNSWSLESESLRPGGTLRLNYSATDATGLKYVSFEFKGPDKKTYYFTDSSPDGVIEAVLASDAPGGTYSIDRVYLSDTVSNPNVSDYRPDGTIYFYPEGSSTHTLPLSELRFQVPNSQLNYLLAADSEYVDEGEIATFTLSTTSLAEGTSVTYTLSGISPSDVKAGLTGKVEIDANGQAVIAISVLADSKTEGDETLTVTVEDKSASVLIRDTSKNPAGVTPPGKRANSSVNEKFEAASGETKLEFAGNSGNFKVRSNDGGKTWELSSPETGTDTVTGFKRIALDDKTIALDFQAGDAGYSSVMLIGAAFGKDLVPTYFSAGVSFFDAGLDTTYLCELIASAGLIESQIGNNSTRSWVKHVYKNVVGALPDELTEVVFTDLVDSGVYTRATLLKAAAELSLLESQVDITGLQSTGLTYTPFG